MTFITVPAEYLAEYRAYWMPVNTPVDIDAVHSTALEVMAQQQTAAAGAAAALEVILGSGLLPVTPDHLRIQLRRAAVFGEGLRRYGDSAWQYYEGYLFSWNTLGQNLAAPEGASEAWEAGRIANPDFAAHQAADHYAEAATAAKFGAVKTIKAQSYRDKQYAKHLAGRAE